MSTSHLERQVQTVSIPPGPCVLQNHKRKREDSEVRPYEKQKKDGIATDHSSRDDLPLDPPSSKLTKYSGSAPTPPTRSTIPLRGPSKPTPAPNTPKASAPTTTKVPKKGSYAEIMARAKAAEPKAAAVGIISHKPKEKAQLSYKKEMQLQKKAAMNKKLGIKDIEKRPSSSGSISSNSTPGPQDNKNTQQPAYRGTAKPTAPAKPVKPQPTYRGTMKAGDSTVTKPDSKVRDGKPVKLRYDEYAATDEEDLDDVEEDDYGSDESDDMEAGFSDVEQEETLAARTARLEDEAEAKLEVKLKREKEERKRKLEALSKKAKPTRY